MKTIRAAAGLFSSFVGLIVLAGCAAAPTAADATQVIVKFLEPTEPIASDFVGLSIETRRILADPFLPDDPTKLTPVPARFVDANNPALLALFRTMGVRSLRVGGNTVDRETIPKPTEADVDALFDFAKAADVKVIYAVRLKDAHPEQATEIARYIWGRYARQLTCFEIGNEPDKYFTTYEAYRDAFQSFVSAIAVVAPNSTFCGPCTTQGHPKWAAQVASDFANGRDNVRLITHHVYACGNGTKADKRDEAIDKLLSHRRAADYQKVHDSFVPAVREHGQAYRLEETNNFHSGGAPNASNTFASALWALDYMHWWALHGAAGLNFHTSDFFPATMDGKPTWYGALAKRADGSGYDAKPLAYAMATFSATKPARVVPIELDSPAEINVTAYATQSTDGRTFLTVINKSHEKDARDISVRLPAGFRATQRLTLSAPNVTATDGVRLGDASIEPNGEWTGRFAPINNAREMVVASASATVFEIAKE